MLFKLFLGHLQKIPLRLSDDFLRRIVEKSFCGNLKASLNFKIDLTVKPLQHRLSLDNAEFLHEFFEIIHLIPVSTAVGVN